MKSWLALLFLNISLPLCAQDDSLHVNTCQTDSSCIAPEPKPRPWLALAEAEGINLGLLAFDHYVLDASYAQVTMNTVTRNAKLGEWFWDSDLAYTNLFEHPYHGALYFNSARSNGLSFWQSAPFAVGGSLLWEIAGECELPSVNDFAATSVGGIAIGEVTHRLSSLVLNDSRRGFPRFLTELIAAAIDPPRGLNRVIRGDAWRVRHDHHLYHDYKSLPVNLSVTSGWRHLDLSGKTKSAMNSAFFDISIRYGKATDCRHNKPFDYFLTDARIVVGGHQNLLNHANIIGRLRGWRTSDAPSWQSAAGIYQFFNYRYTDKTSSDEVPYILSEAASIGPGFTVRHTTGGTDSTPPRSQFEASTFVSGIGLGGSASDHIDGQHTRNYSFGSGFSTKLHLMAERSQRYAFSLWAEYTRLFTWKSYEKTNYKPEIHKTSAQGDAGNTWMMVVSPRLDIKIAGPYWLTLSGDYLLRHTNYKYHPHAASNTRDLRIGLKYQL